MNRKEIIFYERLVAGDFSDKKMEFYNKTLNESDKKIIENIRKEHKTLRETYPMDIYKHRIIQKVKIRSHLGHKKVFKFLRISIPVTACFIVLIFSVNILFKPASILQAKGKASPMLSVYRKTAGGVEKVNNFSYVKEGESLQITYKPDAGKYGFVFSIDGERKVTYIYPGLITNQSPDDITEPFRLERDKGREVALPYSYTLDNAPDCEVIFFIVSDKPFHPGEKAQQVIDSFSFNSSHFSPRGEMEFIILLKKEGTNEENN